MASSFAIEDRNYLRQRYFEAKDQGGAVGVEHYQALLGNASPWPSILSGKMITDLKRGRSLSSAEEFALDTTLAEAITSNQQYIWYRLRDAFPYESTVTEFCHSFFASRAMREERSTQSYLVLRIIDLTFCQQEIDPAPELLDDMRYLIICKVQDFVDFRFTEMEEGLEEVEADQRAFKEEFFQTIHKIREMAASLWGKLSTLETRPLLCGEEMSFVKQALGLYETEVSYAMALDKATGKQDYVEELRCMMALGKLYAKKREKQALIQSAGMYQYALRLIEDPQYLPTMQADTRHARRTEILGALGRVELQLLHLMGIQTAFSQEEIEGAKAFILANRKNLQEKRKIIDKEIAKLGEEPSPQQIVDIHCFIADFMKLFTVQLIEQCTAIMGKKPCSYAVIGLGSMARKEMTHYSDLEFAILIEEEAEQHKEYFRNLTYLLHLKVVNLGETILPALNVPCLTGQSSISFFDGITPRGFAFDGAGVKGKGCKTPLGNGITFELIQTPTKMAQYLGRDHNAGVDWPEREPHLPMELLNFVLITGDESLYYSYRKALDEELSNPYREGVDLRNYLARMHLVAEDEQQLDPELNDSSKEGQLFKVKQDLYRFPHLSIDRLALLSNLQVFNTMERIEELNRLEVLNAMASGRLQWLISEVIFQRLKVYSHYKAQQEWMNPLIKAFGLEDPQLVQKQFALDKGALKKLTKIYQILIPLYEAVQIFLKGDPLILQEERLWDESDFTLGQIAVRLLQYEQARAYYLKSLAIREKTHGKEHPDVAESLANIGNAYYSLGKAQKALAFHQRALTILEKIHGKEHPDVTTILNHIGGTYYSLGKVQEALSYHKKALTIHEKLYGKEHPDVANSLNNIGSAYLSLGKAQEALSFLQRALAIKEKIHGKEHPHIARSLNNIGSAYNALGRVEEALTFHQKALTIREKIYGKEHPDVAEGLNNIGSVYHSLGKAKKALSYHQKALIIREKIYGKEHPSVARSLNNIGSAYYSLGKIEEAFSFCQRALTISEKTYGKEHPDVATSLANIGSAYHSLGKVEEALTFHQRALTILEKIHGKEHPHVAASLHNIGIILYYLKKMQEALSCFQKVLPIWEKIYGNAHPRVIESRKIIIAATYQIIEHPQQKIAFILAEYSRQTGVI